jgi:hypothetical protein
VQGIELGSRRSLYEDSSLRTACESTRRDAGTLRHIVSISLECLVVHVLGSLCDRSFFWKHGRSFLPSRLTSFSISCTAFRASSVTKVKVLLFFRRLQPRESIAGQLTHTGTSRSGNNDDRKRAIREGSLRASVCATSEI